LKGGGGWWVSKVGDGYRRVVVTWQPRKRALVLNSLEFPPCRCAMSRQWLHWGGGSVVTTVAATLVVVVVAVNIDLGDG